ncbi:MAG: site-2 protease family protein [Pirellulaceae bacterium]|nr:site-2 protease family protein [Pirellulaceae bacterium]
MKVGKVYGIDVHVHWSFWVLVLFYLISVSRTGGIVEGVMAVTFILAVFACVLLHEFGHAAAAAYYGIPTRDITLLPFGGIARIERMPDKPLQELVVALAGPAVNIAIAALFIAPVTLGIMTNVSAPAVGWGTNFLAQLLVVNLLLVGFNLLPAFPMDGGRVLRSLLAIRLGHLRATQVAVRTGRWMALAFAIWAVVSLNVVLLLIAGFIYFAGLAELIQVRMRIAGQAADSQSAGAQHWSYQYSSSWAQPSQNAPNSAADDDIIDAVEVRHIR